MNFKKILGSFLSVMTLFTTSPVSVMAFEITDETTLNDYMVGTDIKDTGYIRNNITTTVEHEAKNAEIKFYASGDKVLSGELLRFTDGKVTLSQSSNSSLTINNDIYLSGGVVLSNDITGSYNFGRVLGAGTLNFYDKSSFTASEINATDLSLSNSSLTMYTDASKDADGSIFVNGTLLLDGSRSILTANNIETIKMEAKNVSVVNAKDIKADEIKLSSSTVNVNKANTDGKNIGKISTKDLTVDLGSKLYADVVDATGNVSVTNSSEIDLVGDEASSSGLSQNGILSVDGKLYINANSSVRANEIEANEIDSTGKIIIGQDGLASTIKVDTMAITRGDYTNTIITGKTDSSSNLRFTSGHDVSFSGELNQLQIKGGSKSENGSINIANDSSLKIVSGVSDAESAVLFDNANFVLGENAKLKLNAQNNDIEFNNSNKKFNNIEMSDNAEVSVDSGSEYKVILDNINHGSNENKGTLTVSGNAQIRSSEKNTGGKWVSGQIYVDKYVQNADASMTMQDNSTLNANTININGSSLTINNIANGTLEDGKTQKDGILANDSFNMTNSVLTASGKNKIESKNNLDFVASNINVKDKAVLSLGAGTDLLIDSNSAITTDGEIRFFGDGAEYDVLSAIYNGDNSTGSIRKVGTSILNIGTVGSETENKVINSMIIGADDTQVSDFVGGTVNINEIFDVKNVTVVGDSTVNVAEGIKFGDLNNGTNSKISFKNNHDYNNKAGSDVESTLNLGKGATLTAAEIELSVKEANLYGGTVGGDNTTKLIFGDKSQINVYNENVAIMVQNANSGGFVTKGSTINLNGKGSLLFESPIASSAHWNILTANTTQKFKADSWFDGIVKENKIYRGGVFNIDGGSVVIGDGTVFGAQLSNGSISDGEGNLVGEAGGAIYNTGYFGSEITGAIASSVSFIKNYANAYTEDSVDPNYRNYVGKGGAIYNTRNLADPTKSGEISLGSWTTFKGNAAGESGGAIYNNAANSSRGSVSEEKNAISLGAETLFYSNAARENGGAIYTANLDPAKDSVISIGKKSLFLGNTVGFDLSEDAPNGTTPDKKKFYTAEGGAVYVGNNATLDVGEHSGFYENFSSYSGSAISNYGTVIFNDDGKINDEALRENNEVVQGAVKFAYNGFVEDEREEGNVFYTHQGGAILNRGGKFITKLSNGTQKDGLYNAEFESNQALFGGAIYNYASTANNMLSVENSTFKGNQAVKGIEVYKDPANPSSQNKWQLNSSGGAIYNAGTFKAYDIAYDPARGYYPVEMTWHNSGSNMKITSSTFENNAAVDKAGAIYNDVMSSVELSDVLFHGNSATKGGAVYNTGSDGTRAGGTITTKLGAEGEKIIFSNNEATRQMLGDEQVSPNDEYFGGALYNAGTIKQSGSTSSYDNEIIGIEFNNNYAGAGVGTDVAKDVIGRGGAFYNASAGTTYIGKSKFEGNFTNAYTKDGIESDNYKSEGGAVYNEKGTLVIGEGAEFVNNGGDTTGRGGAVYNNANLEIISDKAIFSGNNVANEGGAIYNAKDAVLTLKEGVKIGVADSDLNWARLGGGIFNAGEMTLEDNVLFVNNSANKGGGLYLKEGSSVNVDSDGASHLSNVIFDKNYADYGAGLYVDKNINIILDNVTFTGNNTSEIGSAFYNAGNMTLGENNKFENNYGTLIGNSGTLTFEEGFEFDGLKIGNQNNTGLLANEKDGVVNLTVVDGKSLVVSGVGNGGADGAAISLKDNASINTDLEANTIKNASFTKNNGNNGGAVYKVSTVDLTIKDTNFEGNTANIGGAIYNEKGKLFIGDNTVFTANSAGDGGAIYNSENASIEFVAGYRGFSSGNGGNYAYNNGGAVANYGKMNIQYADDNSLSIDFSNQGKEATGSGGALFLGTKSLVTSNNGAKQDSKGNIYSYIKNAVFSNNKAASGGALFNESNLYIEDTNFTGNISSENGGAIYNRGNTIDGKSYGNLNLILSDGKTLIGNESADGAGAIYNENGTVTISAKDGQAIIGSNKAYYHGGAIVSSGADSVLNINGNIKFKDNVAAVAESVGGAIHLSEGILNFDTTAGDIVFEGNYASSGSAIFAENDATINFAGDANHGITFKKDQTIASDESFNKMNVLGSNVKFESSLGDFTGQYKQTGGTVTVANRFMNLQDKNNEITGGTFILTEGAKLAKTDDTLGDYLRVNGKYSDVPTIRFENNSVSKLTDLSAIYKDENTLTNAGSSLTYTSDEGAAKISLSNAKLDLALKQKLVDVVDSETGKTYKTNSGEYDLILDGGKDKNPISIAKDGKHAVSDLVLGDAVKVSTNIEIGKDGKVSLEGAGLATGKNNYVKKIELKENGRLNIFNDSYESTVGSVTTKYNTDLTFYGDLIGDSSSHIYKGYKTSPTEDGLAGRATLTFDVLKDENGNIISAASAADYLGEYIQNAGTLEFKDGSTFFNHTNSQISFVEKAKLILNEGVKFTGDTTINIYGDGSKFVLGNATDIDMTNPNEKVEFDAKDVDGNDVHNTVILGKNSTIQVTHGDTDVNASDDEIKIGPNNAFSGIIIGGEENTNDNINITVKTEDIEGNDTIFTVEENGKLGFGDVNFKDTAGNDATNYSPTVTLGKNAEMYLVSERDNDFKNLDLSTEATAWSATSGNLVKENASKTTLTGDNTDLSDFHGTIIIKNGEIALGDDVTNDKKFADDTHFDLSKMENNAVVNVTNITSGNDMSLINGIGNEIFGTATGDEKYTLSIKNDKGGIKFVNGDGTAYKPDIDVENGSFLKMEANGDIDVEDINVISKFSSISGNAQESQAGLISQGNISTGEINVIGAVKNSTTASSTLLVSVKGNIVSDGNVDVEYGKLGMESTNGSIIFGDAADTVNPALNVVNGFANIEANDALTINGKVNLEALTEETLLQGSAVSMDSLTVASSNKNALINSTTGSVNVNGNVAVSDAVGVQLSAGNGIGINSTTTENGNLNVSNSTFNAITNTGHINIDGNVKADDSAVNIIVKENGVGNVTIGNNDVATPAISAENSTVNIYSEGLTKINGNVALNNLKNASNIVGKSLDADGDLSVTNSKYETNLVAKDGNLTVGKVNLDKNKLSDDNVVKTVFSAINGDITTKGDVLVNEAGLVMVTENGGINISSTSTGAGTALKVSYGSAQINAEDGALTINGDVDMTAITADAFMQGSSVAMGNLKLHENTKDTVINATDGDVSIKSIKLDINNDTVGGVTANKTIQIGATNGGINVQDNIDVNMSNLTMVADGGITGKDLTVTESKVKTVDIETVGTILSAGTGDISLNKVSVNNSVVGLQSTSGNINIDKTFEIADTTKLSQAYINAEAGSLSIGGGLTAPADNSALTAISAQKSYVVAKAGDDVKIGNDSVKTKVIVDTAQMMIESENGSINASNSDFSVSGNDVLSSLYVIAKDNVSVGNVNTLLGEMVTFIAQNGNLSVNGDVVSLASATSLVGGDGGVNVTGSVSSINNAGTVIKSTGNVYIGRNVTLANNVSGSSEIDLSVDKLSNNTTTTSTYNNDTPNERINGIIGTIQDIRSDVTYDSSIDGRNVLVNGNLTADSSNLAVGSSSPVSKFQVNGATDLDNSVVMINSSGKVVTNGFNATDSLVTIKATEFDASSMNVSSSNTQGLSYLEMLKGSKINVTNNMTMSNTILNAKYVPNISVGGAGKFNNTFLNIPSANAQFGSLNTTNTVVNLKNNKAGNTIAVAGDYAVSGDNVYYMDFNPSTGAYDRVHAGGAITGTDGSKITVNSNIIGRGDIANGYQVYDVFSADRGVSGVNFGLEGNTSYSTVLAKYQMQSLGGGKYAFKRSSYNPAAMVNPVAVQVGGFLTQVQTYDTAFENLDMVMMLPMTAYGPNRYAVSEADDAMVYSPLFIPELEKGIWFRPFANFENIDMSQIGDDITSQSYGALVGGDTALKDLGNGYQGMMSAYVGYTGSHQDIDGLNNLQNGGVVGVTGAIYKNGFFSGLTVSANASGNSASTPVGDNDFLMLTAGVASKTGYNWELANGRFIIQPSWLMSYTFSDIYNTDKIAGMKVDADALHAVQLAPGLKLIGNFSNGWQPYLTVDYRFNLCDEADYKVGVVDLPEAKVKSYIEYGVGMQKRWGDRFTGYGQFLGRGIGRNGVGLNLGMRWMMGSGRNPR